MNKPCNECPHFVKNKHNDMIIDFAKRTKKSHNCHMTVEGKKNLWDVKNNNTECYGAKIKKNN
jgi:hypothetical protein